jgi:hypothetical protein
MFYKAKFSLSALKENDDLLWRLIVHIRDWQSNKWNKDTFLLDTDGRIWTKLKFGGRIKSKDNNNTIYIESEYFSPTEKERYWACRIVEKNPPKQGTCLRQWVTEIGFEQVTENIALFSESS